MSEPDYIRLSRNEIETPDGLVWRLLPAGSPKIPGDHRSGVWNSDRVEMWTGNFRRDPDGKWLKNLIALPIGTGCPTMAEYRGRGMKHPGEKLPEDKADWNPSILECRQEKDFAELAQDGVKAARVWRRKHDARDK